MIPSLSQSISVSSDNDCVTACYGCDPTHSSTLEPSSLREYEPENNPVGIVLAPTGMIPVRPHQKGRVKTPYVPIDEPEIVETVIACNELGVGGVHLHARESDGCPTQCQEPYARIIEKVRHYCGNIIIGVTTSGRRDLAYEGRSKC